jgi:predicted Zn-dependent protease
MQGSSNTAMRSLLQFSRTQESAADQAAVRYLDSAGESAQGLIEFLEVLADQELLSPEHQDAYARTHPVSRDRIDQIVLAANKASNFQTPVPAEIEEAHRRMQAKLHAFLNRPSSTMITYKESDGSMAARYARAIALYRIPDIEKALAAINELIAEEPNNPYFLELKGQMLFENGHVADAVAPYEASVSNAPDAPQLRIGLARALIESGDRAKLKPAIAHLLQAIKLEPTDSFAWRQLAIAYGRDEQLGLSALAQAEEAAIQRRATDAVGLANKAMRLLPKGSPAWLRAQDISHTGQKPE